MAMRRNAASGTTHAQTVEWKLHATDSVDVHQIIALLVNRASNGLS